MLPWGSQHLDFRILGRGRVELVFGVVCARHVALVVEEIEEMLKLTGSSAGLLSVEAVSPTEGACNKALRC